MWCLKCSGHREGFDVEELRRRVLAEVKDAVSEESREALTATQDGAKALALIPAPWNERLSPLIRSPRLQLESLVISQQFDTAREMLQALPGLRAEDDMLLHYARLAHPT
jgi:hypothetical protein